MSMCITLRLRRCSRSLLILCLFLCISFPVSAGNGDTIVHITSSGTCYHRAGCRYLSSSDYEITLVEAHTKYSPCSVCDPPIFTDTPDIIKISFDLSDVSSSQMDDVQDSVDTLSDSGTVSNGMYDIPQFEPIEIPKMSDIDESVVRFSDLSNSNFSESASVPYRSSSDFPTGLILAFFIIGLLCVSSDILFFTGNRRH